MLLVYNKKLFVRLHENRKPQKLNESHCYSFHKSLWLLPNHNIRE